MAIEEEEDLTTYKVVVNHEEQYSIWPVDRENPLGWEDRGPSGPKAECLTYIGEVWTDMRPLSLRKHMEEVARQQAENRHRLLPHRVPSYPNRMNSSRNWLQAPIP